MMREHSPIWQPFDPRASEPPRTRLWSSVGEVIEAYQRAERPVRIARSQRYSLVVTAPLPEPTWSKR